jgi:copper transport protein
MVKVLGVLSVNFIKRINNHSIFLLTLNLFMIITFFFVSTSVVYAHSSLEKTLPESGEILETSPSSIELWFQNEVVVTPNSITLTNKEGEEFPLWTPQIDTKDRRHISVVLDEVLPPGYYTVRIRVSAIDGDPLRESYQFVVEKSQFEKDELWRILYLDKSNPEDGTIVAGSPKQIDLWFNRPANISTFGLFDDHQRVVKTKQPLMDPENPKHYTIELEKELSSGTYTISWYASIGGKEKNGVIYFAVNEMTSIIPPQGTVKKQTFSKVNLLDVSKWLVYLGLLTLVGGTWFNQWIAKQGGNNERWKRVALFLYILSIGGLVLLLYQRWTTSFQASWLEFISLTYVWIPIVQIILLTTAYWFSKGKPQLLLFLVIVLMWSFTGHAALYGGILAIAINALHLLGVSVWMGGLLALLLMTPKESPMTWLMETGKSYSKWALLSIAYIIVTGVWMTVEYVPTFTVQSLFNSEWGKMLWLKIALVLGIIFLGYFQRQYVKRANEKLMSFFFLRSRVELVIGVLILIAAAILANLTPSEAEQGIYPKIVVKDGIEASVDIEPFTIGANDVTIRFKNNPTFERVHVKFAMPPQWKQENSAFDLGGGTYRLTGNFLHTGGAMYMEVLAVTADGQEFTFPFRVQIPGKAPESISY